MLLSSIEIDIVEYNNLVDKANISKFNSVLKSIIYLNLLEEPNIINKLLVILYTIIRVNY